MKKTLGLISFSFFTVILVSSRPAHADETDCRAGFHREGDMCVEDTKECPDGQVIRVSQICAPDLGEIEGEMQNVSAVIPGASCGGTMERIARRAEACGVTLRSSKKRCDPNQGKFAEVVREGQANARRATADVQRSSDEAKKFNEKLKAASQTAQADCQSSMRSCEEGCVNLHEDSVEEATRASCLADERTKEALEELEDQAKECKALSGNIAKFKAQAVSAGLTAQEAEQNKNDTAASEDPSAQSPGSSDTTSNASNAEEKKSNGMDMGSLMGLASGLMGMMNQQQATEPVAPVAPMPAEPFQLAADSCDRPENASTVTCICRFGMNTPGCMAAANKTNTTNFSSVLPMGTGGAQLVKDGSVTDQLDLGSEAEMPQLMPVQGDPTLNAQLAGGYDTGGLGAGGGNKFTPDQNPGNPGSSLSADIYTGTRGGSSMFASGGRSGSYVPRDPDQLPGYRLDKPEEKVNFKQFMPRGAGTLSHMQGPPGTRSISGMVSPPGAPPAPGMHPASADLFQAVSMRYRDLDATFYPYTP